MFSALAQNHQIEIYKSMWDSFLKTAVSKGGRKKFKTQLLTILFQLSFKKSTEGNANLPHDHVIHNCVNKQGLILYEILCAIV